MNNETSQPHNFKQDILDKIQKGDVKMKSRAFHIVKVTVVIIVATLILFTSAFLVSFFLFSFQVGSKFLLIGFGWQGVKVFLTIFPWHLLLIEIALLISLELLLKQFQFGYRSPMAYIITGMLVISVALGILIDAFPIHTILLHKAEKKQLPMIGGFYQNLRRPPQELGVFKGQVTAIKGNMFIISTVSPNNEQGRMSKTVIVPPFLHIDNLINVGDTVFVAGTLSNGQVQAYGVQKLLNIDED
jgi:hypothetical protein